jgi:hypothetical protein
MRQLRQWPIKLLRGLWIGVIGLILIFEEWGWVPLARLMAWIGRLPGLRWIEALIRGLPPYGALALFVLPVLTLLPIKIAALYLLGQGHTVLGLSMIVVAKLVGTAVTARLFMLTQPTLMRLAWFAHWFGRWMVFKNNVVARVKSSLAWQEWLRFKTRVKRLMRRVSRLWRRPWDAAGSLPRQEQIGDDRSVLRSHGAARKGRPHADLPADQDVVNAQE